MRILQNKILQFGFYAVACFLCGPSHALEFIHPGLSLNQQELLEMKEDVANGVQPRTAGWEKMLTAGHSWLSYTPNPVAEVAADGGTSGGFADDILAAYSHALQWIVTGDSAHAKKSIEIMNGWANVLTTIDNHPNEYYRQEVLVAGWSGQPFAEAAEIIRHTYDPWTEAEIVQFEEMLKTVFYPLISDHSNENGNWEASSINSMIAIGVFTNDAAIFQRGVDFFRGTGKGAVGVYIYESGECQEVCRDMGHTQMGLGELVDAAEIAWKQGVNLYGELPNPQTGIPRLAEGLEFAARILNGDSVGTTCGMMSKPNWGLDPMWQKAWNHYGNRLGLDLPNIKRVAERVRPEGYSWKAMYSWGTLTHAQPPVNQAPVVSAGSAQTINLPSTATLSGSASDDGFPDNALTTTWTKHSGPGTVTFGNAASLSTTASFSEGGSYVLRLTASDGELSSASDVSVTVIEAPTFASPPSTNGVSNFWSFAFSGNQWEINSPEHGEVRIVLYSVGGLSQVLYRGNISEGFLRLNPSGLSAGVYYLSVRTADGREVFRKNLAFPELQ
jgi:hypothetical protein